MDNSVYRRICSAMTDGRLPEGFRLYEVNDDNLEEIQYWPGSYDGIMLFGGKPEPMSEHEAALMKQAIAAGSAGDFETADRLFDGMAYENGAIGFADDLQNCIASQKDTLDQENISRLVLYLLTESQHEECVKTGLLILELYGEPPAEIKTIVRTLALYDEFSLPAVWNIRHWADANEVLFDLARNNHGWGRIYAVTNLSSRTQEIRDWLFREGFENRVFSGYTAKLCWDKGDVEEKLYSDSLSGEDFNLIMRHVKGMIHCDLAPGICDLPDEDEILIRMLNLVPRYAMNEQIADSVYDIFTYAKGQEPLRRDMDRIIMTALPILQSPAVRTIAEAASAEQRCLDLAEELGIPFQEHLLETMRKDFRKNWKFFRYLLNDDACREAVIALFMQNLPLKSMRGNPKDTYQPFHLPLPYLQMEQMVSAVAKYPMTGTGLVKEALCSKMEPCRVFASWTLESWVQKTHTDLKELSEELYDAARKAFPDRDFTFKESKTPDSSGDDDDNIPDPSSLS